MGQRFTFLCLLALCIFTIRPQQAAAEVRLPSIFGDHMVLQRDKPLPVWGWAEPGQSVRVTLRGQTAQATADQQGAWRVTLRPESAATGLTLTVQRAGDETDKIELTDVAVGEVWVCSGQSNMQWSVAQSWNHELMLSAADRPDIRLVSVLNPGAQEPRTHFPGRWERSTPAAAGQFSAVGFHFGKQIADTLGVPVGVIDNAWGGSAAEAWTPLEKLASSETFTAALAQWETVESINDKAKDEAYNNQMERWKKAVERAKKNGIRPPEPPNPRSRALGNQRPANLFNARVKPIAPFAIRGVIWYQGESNSGRAAEYRELFPMMINAWRGAWGREDLPFYWVQLADFRAESPAPQESSWAKLREAQTMTLDRLPNTGQAVIIDLGEASDIHPRNKQEVANRLARWALAKDYGYKIAHASPRFESLQIEGERAIVTFKDVANKLRTVDARELQGFAIAGADKKWHFAKARILDKNRVEVSSPRVTEPVAVRYAWADNPVCNLYDASGLPATPFRTDDWPTK